MSDKTSETGARDYRIVRACFTVAFVVLCAWLVSRQQFSGWPLLLLVLSALSAVINFGQALTGPPRTGDDEREERDAK